MSRMHPFAGFAAWTGGLALVFAVASLPRSAAGQEECTCDDLGASICSAQGFEITLVGFSIDQNAGTSVWNYKVCNDENGTAACSPPKDLSHVNLDLPGLGSCLTEQQSVTLSQTGGFAAATLACGVSPKDPSCGIFGDPGTDFVAKCDVVGPTNLDPGECVNIRLTIAGEKPTLGAGVAETVTKAGRDCRSDCILGPSCEPCGGPGEVDECLTRSPGFWGNHPHITTLFTPITVCGVALTNVDAGNCSSATEALCVSPGTEAYLNPAYASLVRQLSAAKLNLAASAANGGSCAPEVDTLIANCESLCNADQATISGSGCIEALGAFNGSLDTFSITPAPFDRPGPASSVQCSTANGNGVVIHTTHCSTDPRPKKKIKCGIGFEVALLLAPLIWAAGRRRGER